MSDEIPIKVVDDEEAEQADFVVCARADCETPFTDNVVTACCDCGAEIIHRPYIPTQPLKICLECVVMRMEGGHA